MVALLSELKILRSERTVVFSLVTRGSVIFPLMKFIALKPSSVSSFYWTDKKEPNI